MSKHIKMTFSKAPAALIDDVSARLGLSHKQTVREALAILSWMVRHGVHIGDTEIYAKPKLGKKKKMKFVWAKGE